MNWKRSPRSFKTVREQRPSLISTRQPEAQSELEATRTELNPDLSAEATAPGRVADRTVLLAQEVKLLAELEMLKQEKISTTARRRTAGGPAGVINASGGE